MLHVHASKVGKKGVIATDKSLVIGGTNKLTKMFVIYRNNTVANKMVTPPGGVSSHVSSSSRARARMTQATIIMEIELSRSPWLWTIEVNIFWKPTAA